MRPMTARQAASAVIGPRAETMFAAAATVKPSDAVKGARRCAAWFCGISAALSGCNWCCCLITINRKTMCVVDFECIAMVMDFGYINSKQEKELQFYLIFDWRRSPMEISAIYFKLIFLYHEAK
jgi:hypothetical protein